MEVQYAILVNYLKILIRENSTFIDKEKIELILKTLGEEVK